jgi:hypothetical protein
MDPSSFLTASESRERIAETRHPKAAYLLEEVAELCHL